MKRFEWRLQRILDIKDKAERLKRAELLHLGEQLAEAHAVLRGQQRMLRDTLNRVASLESSLRIREQALVLKQSAHNDQHIRRLRETIAQIESQKEAKAAEVLALRREREGLERLRAQAWEAYQAEMDKQEQKDADDRVSMRYAHARRIATTSAAADSENSGY